MLAEQPESVLSVAFNPIQEDILAVGRADGTIRLWNISTPELLHTLGGRTGTIEGHTDVIFTLAFSPDGNKLASGSADGTVRVWNTTDIENQKSTKELWKFSEHNGLVLTLAFLTENGNALASGSKNGSIRFWNIETGEWQDVISGDAPAVLSLASSPKNNLLATGRSDKIIRVWNLTDGDLKYTFDGHKDDVTSLAFNSDGNTLISGSADGTVQLWDISPDASPQEFTPSVDGVNSVALHETTLASAGFDGAIFLWDVNTKEVLYTLTGHAGSVESIAFSRDGKTLASGGHDGKVLLWKLAPAPDAPDLAVNEPCSTTWETPDSRVFSERENRIVTARTDGYVVMRAYHSSVSTGTTVSGGAASAPPATSVPTGTTVSGRKTSSLMPAMRWTPAETVINDLGTTVITIEFLNGTSADRDCVMDTITGKNGWAGHANVHFVAHSDPNLPSDIRVEFHSKNTGNNSHVGIETPLKIAAESYADIERAIGGVIDAYTFVLPVTVAGWITRVTSKVVHRVPIVGWVIEQYANITATYLELQSALKLNLFTLIGGNEEKIKEKAGQATMNLTNSQYLTGSCSLNQSEQGIILHEFGHALGFHHTHKSDKFPFDWVGKTGIENHYDTNWGWDKDKVKKNLFDQVVLPESATFDPDSIMTYELPGTLSCTVSGPCGWLKAKDSKHVQIEENGIAQNHILSNGDKRALCDVYGPHKDAYLVEGKIHMEGVDDDLWSDTKAEATRDFYCIVASQDEYSTIHLPDFYVGNEVRVEIAIGSQKEEVNGFKMKATVRLFEGISIVNSVTTDLADEETLEFSVPINDNPLTDQIIEVKNEEIKGVTRSDDRATVTLQGFKVTPLAHEISTLSDPTIIFESSTPAPSITSTESHLIVPENTELLPNYPNPFNPETWIPYQLTEPADVTLTIYDIQGRVVRDLDLGHQRAGIYHSRARAAHWDGRNTQGEPVASGLYFYTLKAGEFSATRKMLICK